MSPAAVPMLATILAIALFLGALVFAGGRK
jgi:hypothetical protein